MTIISRREAMLRVGVLMGGAISAPTLSILSGCQPKAKTEGEAQLFSAEQENIIAQVAELIIPATDTPGAKDAQVPQWIALMIKDCYPEKDQQRFEDGLDQLDKDSKQAYGDSFMELSEQQQIELLTKAETDARALRAKDPTADLPFFLMMKELTLIGYFTSEPGATQALQYVQNPGSYNACTPVEAGQKAWAT